MPYDSSSKPQSKVVVIVSTRDMSPTISFLVQDKMTGRDKQLVFDVVNRLNASDGFPKLTGVIGKQQ